MLRPLILLLLLSVSHTCSADVYALIVPQVSAQSRAVFDQAREAIAAEVARTGDTLVERSLPLNGNNGDEVREWLASVHPAVVLALGRTSYEAVLGLERRYHIVVGMTDFAQAPRDISVASLFTEPRDLFASLRQLSPNTQRIFVVYSPSRLSGFVSRAIDQASRMKLEVLPLRANDLREASLHFANVFRYGNPSTDALWMIDSEFVTDETTLPRIVEESWIKRMPVCSSAPQHLKRGALCVSYAPPTHVGATMMMLARERLAGGAPRFASSDPVLGVNARIARHLGIQMTPSLRAAITVMVGDSL